MSKPLKPEEIRTLIDALCNTPQFSLARERRVLVSHALGDYPSLTGILRWQEWEGSEIVVADELVRKLDGLQPVPGVTALSLLAQAIEPMVGGAHQQRLVELRQRHGWGADPAPASADNWHDDRAPAELIHERIIGENTLRHVVYLRQALRAADAVVKIDVHGLGSGTGFLIAPDLMLTNHHVIADQTQANRSEITFFYQFGLDHQVQEGNTARIAEHGLLLTDAGLDASLLRLTHAPTLNHYPALRPILMEKDQRVAIIQHPGGGLKKVSLQNNLVCYSDSKLLQYYTSTQPGSSGAPVFDDGFNVVGLHRGAIKNADWQADSGARSAADPKHIEALQYRNQGSSMVALLDWLRAGVPELIAELRIKE